MTISRLCTILMALLSLSGCPSSGGGGSDPPDAGGEAWDAQPPEGSDLAGDARTTDAGDAAAPIPDLSPILTDTGEDEPDLTQVEDASLGPRTTDDLVGGGDTCDDPFVVDHIPFQVSGSTRGASADHEFGPDACPGMLMAGGGRFVEEVFRYTPTRTALHHLRVTTAVFLSTTYVVTDCADIQHSCLGATHRTNDQWLDLELQAQTTYYILIDSSPMDGPGEYTLSITIP